jgi:CheY-like chemotaxis protein
VGLQGNLEDLPLLDIIQIVSFSKKTGYLSIQMTGGDGAIVFHDGLVVSAFTASSPPPDPRLATLPGPARAQALRSRLSFAVEQLARLREGAFSFELSEDVPASVGSRDIRLETLKPGINAQELLLELAQGIDEDRAQSAAAVEASFAAPEEAVVAEPATAEEPGTPERAQPAVEPAASSPAAAPAAPPRPAPTAPSASPSTPPLAPAAPTAAAAGTAARTLLLVDDEPDILAILAGHFSSRGYRVEEAGDPESAAKAAARLRESGEPFVLVTDLGMPATGGASFHGGFEVVKRLWKMNLRPPVLMMTESLSQPLRLRAKQMGVQAFVFKPSLSKLNPRQFEADLAAFAAKLAADVLPRLLEAAALRPTLPAASRPEPVRRRDDTAVAEGSRTFEFLRRRLLELRQGGDANQIATLVVKVAREFFERAILFVVKNDEARGLGGFGLAPREEALNLVARQVTIPLAEPSVFQEVAQSRHGFCGPLPRDRWTGHLMGRIGHFQSRAVVLLPLVAHRETIAMLFGDNPESGRAPGDLAALDVFLEQAGTALENVFLQRKLQTIEDRERAGLR